MLFSRSIPELPSAETALPGRANAIPTAQKHFVNGRSFADPIPSNMSEIVVALGCFWGAERLFWQADGVHLTQVGYAGGHTPNPTYEETCSGATGHTEVVRVVFDPSVISLDGVLKIFWEGHDPTQGMRQGNDIGTQYRSAMYYGDPALKSAILKSRNAYNRALASAGHGEITTEIAHLRAFYPAEGYHQQYLAKNPNGYCGLGGTGVSCPIPGAQPSS